MRIVFFLLIFICSCSYKAGPTYIPCIRNGHLCYKAKIYNYPDGKKLHLSTDIYSRKDVLISSKIFYERWPNGKYMLIDKRGFELYPNGEYILTNPTAKIPDNILYPYFDKNLEQQYEVYLNGQRMPYHSGFENETQVNIHTGEKPGVYIWKDNQLIFLREYDSNEKARYENAMSVLHSDEKKGTTNTQH